MYAFLAGESYTQRITGIIDDFCETLWNVRQVQAYQALSTIHRMIILR